MGKKRILNVILIAGLAIALAFAGGCLAQEAPADGGEASSSSILPLILFLVAMFAVFYFLMVRPQRKKQKQQQELMADLRKGDRVITAGGIYGVIESTSDDSIVIKVESGTTLRVARSSVAGKRER